MENTMNPKSVESADSTQAINFSVKRPIFRFGGLTPNTSWDVKLDNNNAVVVSGKAYSRVTFSHEVDQKVIGSESFAKRKDGTIISKIVSFDAWIAINEIADEIDVKLGTFRPQQSGSNIGSFVWYKDASQQAELIRAMPSNQRKLACVQAYYTAHPIFEPVKNDDGTKIDETPRFTEGNEILKLSEFRANRANPVEASSTTPATESPAKTGKGKNSK